MFDEIKNYCEKEPKARERRNRDRAMVNLLLKKYPEMLPLKDKIINICHDFESYSRIWRKVLEECPELRGKDYETKREMVEKHQIELGYENNYHQNQKLLKDL